MVNVWDGNNVDYVIDANTNRYDSVGGNSLTYDAAGNLTTDKDGYRYEYVLIEDVNNADVAEFAYDALGRRIRKIDSIAEETTLYYYNDKWQVLCDYNDSDVRLRKFLYGNYIDEALAIVLADNIYFYSHDHLHSPAALMTATATVLERYEYDAYGNATILTSDFEIRDSSLYDNPYLFTGRRLDILDNGSLKLQYNRNRYYDQYTGRWLTNDPQEYEDGMNLYEYVSSNPALYQDPMGTRKADLKYIDWLVKKFGLSDPVGRAKLHELIGEGVAPHHDKAYARMCAKLVRNMGGKYVIPALRAGTILGIVLCMPSDCYAPELTRFSICNCKLYKKVTTWTFQPNFRGIIGEWKEGTTVTQIEDTRTINELQHSFTEPCGERLEGILALDPGGVMAGSEPIIITPGFGSPGFGDSFLPPGRALVIPGMETKKTVITRQWDCSMVGCGAFCGESANSGEGLTGREEQIQVQK